MDELQASLQRDGFNVIDLQLNSKIIRFDRSGVGKKSGWFVGFELKTKNDESYVIAVYGDWRTGEKYEYRTKREYTKQQESEILRKFQCAKDEAERERSRLQEGAKREAFSQWSASGDNSDCPYLTRKNISQLFGCRTSLGTNGRKLMVPMRDSLGELWGIQTIYPDGKKYFLTGGRIDGCFHTIGQSDLGLENTIYLTEGFATGASVHQAIQKPVVVTFNAQNLPKVAQILKEKYPTANFVICGDDDAFTVRPDKNGVERKFNPGRNFAEKAAKLSGGHSIFPMFKSQENKFTDFNDLHISEGLKAVREQVLKEGSPSLDNPNGKNNSGFEALNHENTSEIEKNYEQLGFYYRYLIPKEEGGVRIVDAPQYKLMADYCFDQKTMCFDDSTSLKFDGKKWKWLSKTDLQNHVITKNIDCIKPAHIDNFIKMIRGRCFINAMNIISPEALINVNNGIVDVKAQKLIPHTYKYMFKYCAPIDYDENATCYAWERFLLEVFDNNVELIDLSQRLFGYILIGGRPFLHRAFVLCGEGRNGKSTYLDVLKAIIGFESYSVVSMAKLDKEFSIVNIDGMLANIVEETPTDQINAEAFKNMVGGGEVQASHKGFEEYKFLSNARFVFACNEMPVFKDKSVGLEDRLVFLPFNRYFKEEERDAKIFEHKLTPELPGILNWAIKGAKLILKDYTLPLYESTKLAKELYREETDPLYSWFKQNIEVGMRVDRDISIKDLYLWYSFDCEDTGNRAYSKDRFSKRFRKLLREACEVKKVGFDAVYRFTDSNGNQERGFNSFNYIGSGEKTAGAAQLKKVYSRNGSLFNG